MTTVSRVGLAVLALSLLAVPALAHVPAFPDDNTSPDRALVVPDAAKSWSFYDRLEPGGVRYYRVSLAAGDRLRFGVFTPTDGDFTPSVVLLSERFSGTERVPAGVTVPPGMGARVYDGARPAEASYEPFTPAANYHTVDVDITVEAGGDYLLAVYEPSNAAGPVGVTVGYVESFSVSEYLTVPFDLVGIHRWEGDPVALVAGPWLLTLAAGAVVVYRRRPEDWHRPTVRPLLLGASLLVVGTAVGVLVQLGLALASSGPSAGMLVTAAYVVVPAVAGGWVFRVVLRDDPLRSSRTRAGLVAAGAGALVTWAGFILGPTVLLVLAAVPARWGRRPGG